MKRSKFIKNAPAYIVNNSLVFSLTEFTVMQELAKKLTEVE